MSHVIALVDDDRNILTSVSIALQAEGSEVEFRKLDLTPIASLSREDNRITIAFDQIATWISGSSVAGRPPAVSSSQTSFANAGSVRRTLDIVNKLKIFIVFREQFALRLKCIAKRQIGIPRWRTVPPCRRTTCAAMLNPSPRPGACAAAGGGVHSRRWMVGR